MRIGLWVEGETDGAFYPALAARILSGSNIGFEFRVRSGRCIKGLKIGLSEILKEFDELRCDNLILCADNHGVSPGERARFSREVAKLVQPRTSIVAIAIQSLEAWLLADHVSLCRICERPAMSQPSSVEDMPDPKRYLKDHLGIYPNHDQLRRIACEIDLDRARRTSPSLEAFLHELEAWRNQP